MSCSVLQTSFRSCLTVEGAKQCWVLWPEKHQKPHRRCFIFSVAPRRTASANSSSHSSNAKAQAATIAREGAQRMEEVVEFHARRLLQQTAKLPTPQKYLVGIAGSPGSGKSTTADAVAAYINSLAAGSERSVPLAVVASMDGYHFCRRQLDEMDDPVEAHARRGAHWTFDAAAFVQAIRNLRRSGHARLPSFDHAVGDPVEDDVEIQSDHKIVIIEGNYVLLDEEPWKELAGLFDESWFIECRIDTAMERVFARQVDNGSAPETARRRVQENDRPNAELIQKSMTRANVIIPDLPYQAVSKSA